MALALVIVLAGCGAGFGAGEQGGSADLAITRDYGSEVLAERTVDDLSQSSTAMRLLDDSAQVETRYGGGFVQSIDGVSGSSGARSSDWFYFVNGIAAERGASEFVVGPGDRMWWDFRDWTDAMEINAVVGSFPAPMKGGYDGTEWPVRLDCPAPAGSACDLARRRLTDAGISLTEGSAGPDSLRLLVGTWAEVESDPDAGRLSQEPSSSGVFARFADRGGSSRLLALDREGRAVRTYAAGSGLVAALRRNGQPPVWVITGTDRAGVLLAAAALDQADLQNRYAALVSDGRIGSLPVTDALAGGSP